MAMAFSCRSLRAVNKARRFWLANVFTCTGRNKLTRIICAMLRASLRSLLLTCLEEGLRVPGFDADDRQTRFR
jgi:hypothetical protein